MAAFQRGLCGLYGLRGLCRWWGDEGLIFRGLSIKAIAPMAKHGLKTFHAPMQDPGLMDVDGELVGESFGERINGLGAIEKGVRSQLRKSFWGAL